MSGFEAFLAENQEVLYQMLRELCLIPAPSRREEKRAEYCREKLLSFGYDKTYIDDALNVICPIDCEGKNEITVLEAHTDTVFPDTEPMPYLEQDGKIFSPGVGDDTAGVAVLLLLAKYYAETKRSFPQGLLLVCNSGEEGLGNLKGTRAVLAAFEGRVKQFISLDEVMSNLADRCVGSHRYRVTVRTEGGHSWSDFGKKNAIAEAASLIGKLYSLPLPEHGTDKTTYNVGMIEGGTSINTIAQQAEFLCEYRSESVRCLEIMKQAFEEVFAAANTDGVSVEYALIAERPCAAEGMEEAVDAMSKICEDIITEVTGKRPNHVASSTDCNIPLSLGIPAICLGFYEGGGIHTREEWLDRDSLLPGAQVTARAVEALTK